MKIRGTTVGTPIKPEKVLVKSENLTEAEKARARENIGAVSVHIGPEAPTDPSAEVWVDTDEDVSLVHIGPEEPDDPYTELWLDTEDDEAESELDAHINSLIDAKLGVIENGSY